MKDYKQIIAEIVEATRGVEDEKLREIAFQKLLEHSLNPTAVQDATSTSDSSTPKTAVVQTRSLRKRSGPSPAVKETSVRPEVKTAFSDVAPNAAEYKPLKELKQKWEKYMWVLVVAKDKGIDRMTNAEIAYVLTEKFSVGATEKTVNNLTFKVEDGYVQKTDLAGTRAWKVLVDGIELIKLV